MEKTTLLCFPFAGGNRYSYRKYEENAPPFLEIVTMEYPGRGSRYHEPLRFDMQSLVDDLYIRIRDRIRQGNYAFYGHSMGGLVGFLLARKIEANKEPAPRHLFVTGSNSPSSGSDDIKRHLLTKDEFIEELRRLKGCPDEVLDDTGLIEHYEPIIRADFKASEEFVYKRSQPLGIPITVITGTREKMKTEEVRLWQTETTAAVDFRLLPGDHFFISKYYNIIIEIIVKKIFKN